MTEHVPAAEQAAASTPATDWTQFRRAIAEQKRAGRKKARWNLFSWFLALCVLTFVWRVQDIYPMIGKLKVVTLAFPATIGFFFVYGYFDRLPTIFRHRVFQFALAILVVMLASIPLGIFATNTFNFIREDHVKTFTLMLLVMAGLKGLADVERLAAVQVLGALLFCWFVQTKITMVDGRLGGMPYYDANDLAMLLVCMVPLCLYFLSRGTPSLIRLMALLALPALLVVLVRSGSRGGFLGLIAVGLWLLFRFSAFRVRTRLIAVTLGVVAMMTFAGDQYWSMMRTLLKPTEDYNWSGQADVGRMEVWKRGIGYMLERPIAGVGAANFYVAEGTLSELSKQQEFGEGLKWSTAHSSFVQLGAELGIPGLIAFLMLLFKAYQSATRPVAAGQSDPESLRTRALGQALAASLVGYLVAGFFLSQAYSAFLYVLFGMITALDANRPAPVVQASVAPAAPQPVRGFGRGGLVTGQARTPPALLDSPAN